MKQSISILAASVMLLIGSATFSSCGEAEVTVNDGTEVHSDGDGHDHAKVYSCPMKCEGDKTYAEAGKCTKCSMDLEQVADHHDDHGHDHNGEDHEGHEHGDGEDEDTHDHS